MMFEKSQLENWVKALKNGEVAAAPAEGVYGYVADPFDETALAKLMALKQRNPGKGLIVLVPNVENLKYVCPRNLPTVAQIAVGAYCPCPQFAPVTLLLPALKNLSPLLTGGGESIAVRCPGTPYMQEYLTAWGGPLVSTSLNVSGEAPAVEASQIPSGVPALTLAEPLNGKPSKIFDPLANNWLRT